MRNSFGDEDNMCRKKEKERLWRKLRTTLVAAFILCSLAIFFFYRSPNSYLISINQPARHQTVEGKCRLSVGRWVEDINGSLYTNLSCSTIPKTKNCFMNGRKDRGFVNWRWKPDDCELPRFDPKTFLEIVRGKKIGFIGDSVARNQFESLLCLLSKEEIPVKIQKVSEGRFQTWHFPYYNFTLMVFWSTFLVTSQERKVNGFCSRIFDLHLDKVDQAWAQKFPGLDYAIISDSQWLFRQLYVYEGGNIIGCVLCNDPNVTDLGPLSAIRMTLRATLNYINNCKDCGRVRTMVRTSSPSHFENGTWNDAGSCSRVAPRDEREIVAAGFYLGLRDMQIEEVERANVFGPEDGRAKRFEVLDVTRPMIMRPDGHPGAYTGNKLKNGSDCVHWCLPSPIDVWNDFLLAILQNKKQYLY